MEMNPEMLAAMDAERTLPMAGGAMSVELEPENGGAMEYEGTMMRPLETGEWEIEFGEGADEPEPTDTDREDHYANLAEFIKEGDLNWIAQEVEDMVRVDSAAREKWFQRMARGLELVGVIDEKDAQPPFKGASTAVHPLIGEAIVQYQARALAELFPATGPAKATVLGTKTAQKEEAATRVADYLNYQSTYGDRSYFAESDKLLWIQASEGSIFRKVYHDPRLRRPARCIVRAQDMIVPYGATTLEDAPRYTHVIYYTQTEMKRLQALGFYRDVPLGIPDGRAHGDARNDLADAKDDMEGVQEQADRDEDNEHTVYEMMVEWDLPGFEDEENGPLPYLISVDKDSLRVLRIVRGWKEEDELRQRNVEVVHYPFIRGDGFYGYGFLHLIGGLGKAATGVLRNILDNAAWSALQGGFKAKDGAKLPTTMQMEPGKWIEIDATAEELAKTFYTPPYKPVPEAMFRVLGLLTDLGQRYASTTDATVGDAKNTGPVGTTVALIEQGQKVATAVHKRSHEALGQELRILAYLNGRYLPEEGYPYEVPGESRQVFAADFDPETIDVEPVSDPNIFSQQQRIAIAQGVLQLSDTAPDLYDRREAHKRMLEAMRVPDVEKVLPPPPDIPRRDPVSENAAAMLGGPLKVFMDQNHDAHIAVHMGQLQLLAAQQAVSAEQFQKVIVPHIAEHEAQAMRLKYMQMLGIQLPPLEATGEDDQQPMPDLPPEVENEIAMRAAQATQALIQQLQQAQAQMQGQPAADQAQADAQSAEAESQRKDMEFKKEQERKDLALAAQIERDDAKAGLDPAAIKAAQEFLAQSGLAGQISARQLATVQHTVGKPFAQVAQMLMAMMDGGQNSGAAPETRPVIGGVPQA